MRFGDGSTAAGWDGRLLQLADGHGQTVLVCRNSAGTLAKVRAGAADCNAAVSYELLFTDANSDGRVDQVTFPDGSKKDFLYDGSRLRTSSIRYQGSAPGAAITTMAGTGTAGFSGDGGDASVAQMNAPGAMIPDPYGNVIVSDTANN